MSENTIIKANGKGLQLVTLADYKEFALCVAKSGMAPRSLDTPEKIFVAVQMGAEVGLTPMQALQSIAVVNGTATIYGDTALGLVRNSGLLEWINEDIEGAFNTNLEKVDGSVRAVCAVKRAGDPDPVERSFSVAEAKLARLWGKAGPWSTHPQRMLKYKARAFALRDVFPDVLKGLHVQEEMHGERIAVESTEVTVSSQSLLEGTDDGVRAEGQPVQPVSQHAEAGGQTGPGLSGPGNGDGGAGVGRRVDQQEPGPVEDVSERPIEAKADPAERPAGDGQRSGGHSLLETNAERIVALALKDPELVHRLEHIGQDDAGKKFVCDKCGTLYRVKPARGGCVADDADGMRCPGTVAERAKQQA
jgi:hypothetical protein